MSGTQGLGQGVGQATGGQAMAPPQAYPQFPMQGQGGQAQPMGVQMPASVQRMQGGFGISPQLLQMIAQLQSRQPQGGGFNPAQFMQKPAPMIQNPYLGQHAGAGGNGTTGH